MTNSLKTALVWMLLLCTSVVAFAQKSVYLEELTTAEVAAMVKNAPSVVIIPVGGTEQNGPHMAIGKHNVRVKVLAGRIAQQLTALSLPTIVAPVVSYVPEGSINPPTEHMKWAGTVSISEDAFKSMLLSAARSFKQHGFTDIVILGDSGNYQSLLAQVATAYNKEAAKDAKNAPSRMHFIGEYYQASQSSYIAALKAKGLSDAEIGTHAGSADTSLLMAIEPVMVRTDKFAEAARNGRAGGTLGDPRAATAALGQIAADAMVKISALAIQKAILK
jgi:creatinine amidohydrolase/Fe(II)-dependent formamide hydrolase-like protein